MDFFRFWVDDSSVVQASSGEWTPDIFKFLEGKWGVQSLGEVGRSAPLQCSPKIGFPTNPRCQEHRRNMPFMGVWINLIPSNLAWLLAQIYLILLRSYDNEDHLDWASIAWKLVRTTQESAATFPWATQSAGHFVVHVEGRFL